MFLLVPMNAIAFVLTRRKKSNNPERQVQGRLQDVTITTAPFWLHDITARLRSHNCLVAEPSPRNDGDVQLCEFTVMTTPGTIYTTIFCTGAV